MPHYDFYIVGHGRSLPDKFKVPPGVIVKYYVESGKVMKGQAVQDFFYRDGDVHPQERPVLEANDHEVRPLRDQLAIVATESCFNNF